MKSRKKKEELLNTFGNFKSDSFNFDLIDAYFRKKNDSNPQQILSDKTFHDLDLHDLFMYVDRTHSKVGQQYLYNKLRTFPSDFRTWERDEKIIEEISQNSELRTFLQIQLSTLNHYNTFYLHSIFQENPIKPPKWFFVVRLLSLASVILLIMTFIFHKLIVLLLVAFIANIFFHYWNKKNVSYYALSIPQLLTLSKVAGKSHEKECLKVINPNLDKSLNVIDSIRKRMLFFQLESKIQNDYEVILGNILELIKILFLLEPLLLFNVLNQLDTKKTGY